MSRLIVLSNRVKLPDSQLAGGLAVGVANAFEHHSGIWLGWNGKIAEKNAFEPLASDNITHIDFIVTPLTQLQYQHYYCGFANNVLWPLLHERLDLVQAQSQDYTIYQQVNALFAKQLASMVSPDDIIWVHDYHFLSVAFYCRQLGMTNRIGFFLHIPFAATEFWQSCEHSRSLLAHLTFYDTIGLQTQQDKQQLQQVFQHFLPNVSFISNNLFDNNAHLTLSVQLPLSTRLLASDAFCADTVTTMQQPLTKSQKCGQKFSKKLIIAYNYPIGVDVKAIQRHCYNNSVANQEQLSKTVRQIIAVDRIDYSKGIIERLLAFELFLMQYPEYQQTIQLLQIACPSRLDLPTYQCLHQQVQQQVQRINTKFEHQGWQPIKYSESVLPHPQLMTVLANSEICWVNSLKDGMNLIAKEYIAAQSPKNCGVLMLSKYAGAAEQMQAAIIIDPTNKLNLVEALKTALNMTLSEKQARYHALLAGLEDYNLYHWQQQFLQDLSQTSARIA